MSQCTSEVEELFDQLEFLISLEFAHLRQQQTAANDGLWFWMPVGRYVWKRSGDSVFERLTAHDNLPPDHALLQAGLLGGTPASATQAVEATRKLIRENPSLRF